MSSTEFHLCLECQVGRLLPGRVSYFVWIDDLFITVPDFPAWVCDVCGWYEYDRVAVAELHAMLQTRGQRPAVRRHSFPASDSEGSAAEGETPRHRS